MKKNYQLQVTSSGHNNHHTNPSSYHLNILLCILLTSFCILPFAAQCQCPSPNKNTELSVNNIRALFKTNGAHFFRESAEFEVPKGSGKSTLFAASLWLGGMDTEDNLHVAAMKYGQYGGNDFWAGPVSNNGANAGVFYDKFWNITKAQIDYHLEHLTDPVYMANLPEVFLNWPAHGRTEYGESTNLAPYVSVSGNNTYTPSLGDYPLIRGDEAIFWINNDGCGAHGESGGEPLGVEILGMAYAFNKPEYELQHTIFLSYEIRNKSTHHYKDFYIGFFADFDIGYSDDDYVGCDSLLNLSYGYNGEETDGHGQYNAYGEHPPAQGVMFLNQKMSAFTYFNNWGGNMGDPNEASDYYNYLQARWKNGTHITYGGDGYDPNSTNYTNFMFSGDPVTQTGWTEITPNGPGSNPNAPADRRGLMSAGPFTLYEGECISVDIALPFARDMEGNNISSIAVLKQNAQAIQQFYNNQNYVGACEVYNPQFCEKPVNLSGHAEENKAIITWNEPESIDGILLGYNVYRDNNKIGATSNSQREYLDKNLDNGIYVYKVSAKYQHCSESELTEGVSVSIFYDAVNDFQIDSFKIYPNPAHSKVTIEGVELNCIEIFDVVGRKLSSVHPTITSSLYQIDISHLQAGIYYIKLFSKENQVVTKRFVIVR